MKRPDDSPIFVIGTGRSGTTLLRQMLNAHPRIHITHEAGFFSYARQAPHDITANQWLERFFETYSFAYLRLSPDEIRAEVPLDLPLSRVDLIARIIMRKKAEKLGKPRYGDKNPLDTANLKQLFEVFPDPRIIYITRDPRPTVFSFNRMPFGTNSTLYNCLLTRVQFEHVRPYFGRILEVRLEDLVADPRAVMGTILKYVDEPWDDAVLDHSNQSQSDDVPPLPWFVGATREQPNQERSGGGWQKRMDPAWIRLVERLNRGCMERYGYEKMQFPESSEPGFFNEAGAILNDLPNILTATYRLLAFKRKIDRHFGNLERLDPQRGMEENLRLNREALRHYPEFAMPLVPALLPAHPGYHSEGISDGTIS